jgi:hypothetical protein
MQDAHKALSQRSRDRRLIRVGAIEEREPAPPETVRQPQSQELPRRAPPPGATEEAIDETGAALFPQLVWAHYQWERKLHSDGGPAPALEQAYRQKLTEFQRNEGRLEQVYWSTAMPPPWR